MIKTLTLTILIALVTSAAETAAKTQREEILLHRSEICALNLSSSPPSPSEIARLDQLENASYFSTTPHDRLNHDETLLFFELLRHFPSLSINELYNRYLELKSLAIDQTMIGATPVDLLRLAAISRSQNVSVQRIQNLLEYVLDSRWVPEFRARRTTTQRFLPRSVLVEIVSLILATGEPQGVVRDAYANELKVQMQLAHRQQTENIFFRQDPTRTALSNIKQQLCSDCYP